MKRRLQYILFIAIIFNFFSGQIFSQSKRFKYLSYAFPSDSIKGFDDVSASHAALQGGYFGTEYKLYMYRAKRDFINAKYNISNASVYLSNNSTSKGFNPVTPLGAPCVNEDFEANNFSGWTITSLGLNVNSCTYQAVTSSGSPEATVLATPIADAYFGTIPASPLGGTRVAKLNDGSPTGLVTRISQTFPVNSNNALFQYAYIAVFQGAHPCCDNPFLNIFLKNCSNQVIACPQVTVVAPGGSCASTSPNFTTPNSSGVSWNTAWQVRSLDLTPYLGSCVTIEVTVGDCNASGHFGYAYFDALCSPMNITVNNVTFPVGTSAATVSACGASNATVTAPPGLNPYSWTGPAGSGITNNPNQTFTTNVAGNYTLTVNPLGSCAPTTRTVNLQFVPSPLATFTASNSCTTFTFTNTGTPSPAIQTYSFVGTGAPASFTTTNPTSVVNFPPSTTFTVIHTVVNSSSCTATNSLVINVPSGPNPAFTTATYTQCLLGNSFTFNAASTPGTHSYSFSPAAGAPAVGGSASYGPVNFTSAGTYTVTHTLTNLGCTSSTSSVVVINPQPTVTANNNGPICVGGNAVLSGTGGGTYNWSGPNAFSSAVQNPTITGVTTANGGVYTLTVTLNGCTGTATTNLSIASSTASAANTGPYCVGQTIQLNGSAGSTFTWTGPGGFTSSVQNPTIANSTTANSGTYNFTVNLGGCVASGSTAVVVNALPTPTITTNSPLCVGQTLNLNGSAAASYTWTGPNLFTSGIQNPSINFVGATAAGTYTLGVTNANNCTNTVTTLVTINASPVIAVNNPTVCVGQTINLTSNGGNTYSWSGPNGFTSALQNPSIANSTTLMTGAYTVTVTSTQGCTNTAISNVNVFPVPSPTIVTNSPVCVGGTLTLSGSGGAQYAWAGPNGFIDLNQNTSIANVTLLADGVYTLLATAGSCSAATTASVTINPLPNPTINSNSPICIGFDINFTGSGGSSYSWIGPNGFTSSAQNPTITAAGSANAGTYTLVVTDANSCVNFTTANVIVNPQPIVAAVGSTVCENGTANLNANGGTTYSWSGPGGFTSTQQSPQITGITMSGAGQYTVIVTDANTCTNTAVANIAINSAPTPSIVTNSPICLNNLLSMSAVGGVSYSWGGPSGFTSSVQNPTLNATSVAFSGIYNVSATDANGCVGTATTNVVINPLPMPSITSGPNKGCAPLCVEFMVNSSPSPTTAAWNMGNGGSATGLNVNSCYNTAGVYTISAGITDQNGCSGVATYTVEVYPKPVADFNHAPIKPVINIDGDVVFTDASYGATIASWNWYFTNTAQYTSNVQNPTFLYTEAGTYAVALVVKSDKGCVDTIVRPIEVGEDYGIYVPNAFSPNDDGLNDIFQPKGFGIVKYELQIFDRWGERIFSTKTFEEGWDGKYGSRGGSVCQNGVYTWLINVTSVFGKSHELKGHVTLIK